MNRRERMNCALAALLWGAWAACAPGITYTPFTSHGDGGAINEQAFAIGAGGTVYEFSQFLFVSGSDLNGTNVPGASARLEHDALPPGIAITFTPQISSNLTDLLLTYAITNSGSNVYHDVRFFSFLDSEIDQDLNTFYNEYGSTLGAAGVGEWDSAPDFWQIDQPGFAFDGGTLVGNLLKGMADGTNHVPVQSPNDVSMALGFRLGELGPGTGKTVRVQISEDGDMLGGFGLENRDSDPSSTTRITFSGDAPVPGRELTNLVANGSATIPEQTSGSYTATAYFSGGDPATRVQDVSLLSTWSVAAPVPPGTFFTANVLVAGNVETSTPIAVQASYTFNDVTLVAGLPVTIEAASNVFTNVTGALSVQYVWALDRQTGTYKGSVRLTNGEDSGLHFSAPWHLSIKPSNDFHFLHASGTNAAGEAYIDFSALAVTALGVTNAVSSPGDSFAVPGFEVFSRYRVAPSNSLFHVWANQF